jgi:F-type H+-transporting ATPase subunit beta
VFESDSVGKMVVIMERIHNIATGYGGYSVFARLGKHSWESNDLFHETYDSKVIHMDELQNQKLLSSLVK